MLKTIKKVKTANRLRRANQALCEAYSHYTPYGKSACFCGKKKATK